MAIGDYSASGLSISLPLPHTATHPRKPTVLVRDLSTREVAVKWIAHFRYSAIPLFRSYSNGPVVTNAANRRQPSASGPASQHRPRLRSRSTDLCGRTSRPWLVLTHKSHFRRHPAARASAQAVTRRPGISGHRDPASTVTPPPAGRQCRSLGCTVEFYGGRSSR